MLTRSPIKRKTALKRTGRLKSGKKTRTWAKVRAELARRFLARGITSCELQLEGCWRDDALGFAHAVKRRKIEADAMPGTPYSIETVILACVVCHNRIEVLEPAEMRDAVMSTLNKRGFV